MKLVYLKKVAHRTVLQIGATILAVLLIAYMGYHIWRQVTSDVVTDTALPVTVESVLDADAYFFRDEAYVTARNPVSGAVISTVAAGGRVPVGGIVARIYDNYDASVVSRLSEIDEQVSLLRASREGTLSLKDVSRLDADIQSMIMGLRYSVYTGDYSAVAASRRELITGINKRQIVIGKGSDIDTMIARLEDEADTLTRQLGLCRETVVTAKSGYFFPSADGYETAFTAAAAENMTLAEFRALAASSPADIGTRTVGKLTETYVWYIACEATSDVASRLTAGETYTVGFPYNRGIRLQLELSRIVADEENDDGGRVLVFRGEAMPDGFSYDRTQPIEIVETEYTGFRIPTSAVRVLDEVRGVYILDGSTVRFRAISILATVDDTVIVDPSPEKEPGKYPYLARNDNVIISGKGLSDGRILN